MSARTREVALRRANAACGVFVLAFIGLVAPALHAACAGAPDEPTQPFAEEPQAAPSQAQPSPDEEGPSSNKDSKTARERGSGEDGTPPQGAPPNLSLEDLHLGEPGQRAKALGALYDELGRAKDAADALPITETIEQIWRLSGSDTVDLLLARADSFVKAADFDMAAQILDAVVELAPDDAEGWYQRAMVHFMQDDYSHALADLKHALLIDPQHYKVLNGLGIVLTELGEKKNALEAFRKALKVNPFLDSARQRIDELSREVEGQDI